MDDPVEKLIRDAYENQVDLVPIKKEKELEFENFIDKHLVKHTKGEIQILKSLDILYNLIEEFSMEIEKKVDNRKKISLELNDLCENERAKLMNLLDSYVKKVENLVDRQFRFFSLMFELFSPKESNQFEKEFVLLNRNLKRDIGQCFNDFQSEFVDLTGKKLEKSEEIRSFVENEWKIEPISKKLHEEMKKAATAGIPADFALILSGKFVRFSRSTILTGRSFRFNDVFGS